MNWCFVHNKYIGRFCQTCRDLGKPHDSERKTPMNKEFIESLRRRFDNQQVITMSELDLLIQYADESMKFRTDFDAWLAACPSNGPRS